MAELLRISEAAKALGVTAKTLRFWEREGILPPPRRNGAGYRLYSAIDLQRVQFALRTKAMGLALNEARELLASAEAACCGVTGPNSRRPCVLGWQTVEARMRDLRMLRANLKRALASVEAATNRNVNATECYEEICLSRR